ncbi:MAG: flagellar hook-basal body complex protein [Planctomycetota bacterium]
MGLQSALTTALTGLQAAETTIDVVGNNVANSQTVGFKESGVVFATQFLQTISIGSAPSTDSGGTNPRQLGLGVKVSQITPDFSQGTIEISSNPLDVAIQGDGFLVVQSGTGELYTRNGQLQLNAENDLVTTTGQRVLGFGINDDFEIQETDILQPLSIPLGQERVAQETSTATLSGVLNPSVEQGDFPEILESRVLGNGVIAQPVTTNGGNVFDSNSVVEAPNPGVFTAVDANTGTGPAAGDYSYRIVFINDDGQEAGISSEVSATGDGDEIQLSGLQDATAPYASRAVYRTDAGGSEFKFLRNIGATGDFTDDGTDTPGATLVEQGLEPGAYSYYVTYYDPSNPQLETRPTSEVGPLSIATDGDRVRLDLSGIAAPPAGSTYTQMRIYRNTSTSTSDFRLLDTVPAFGQGGYLASYIDNTPTSALSTEVLDFNGPVAAASTLLTDLVVRTGDVYENPFSGVGTLAFSGIRDGIDLDEKTLDVTATTNVLDLLNFVRDTLGIATASQSGDAFPNPPGGGNVELINGQIRITSNSGEENAIDIPLTAFQFTPSGDTISDSVTLNFSSIQQAQGPGTSTEFIAYDSLGLPITVRLTTVLETRDNNSTTYRWFATSADSEPVNGVSTVVGDGILTFDSNGDLDASNPVSRISVLRNDTASESPLEITLDFSTIKALGETDARGNAVSTLNVTNQDGFPPGVLTDFIITEDGIIQGQFSNGTQRNVGQIVLARFANNSGLQQVGDSLFNQGVNSGEAIKGVPGSEGIGTLSAGAVELSNTDIGQNLIELILASTQYRGGARVITATQELLDELLALSR